MVTGQIDTCISAQCRPTVIACCTYDMTRVRDQEAKKYDWCGGEGGGGWAPLIGLPPQQLHSHHATDQFPGDRIMLQAVLNFRGKVL